MARDRRARTITHLLFLIPLSIGMGLVGLAAFFWDLHNNQFEDLEGDAWRILTPEDPPDEEGPPIGEPASRPCADPQR